MALLDGRGFHASALTGIGSDLVASGYDGTAYVTTSEVCSPVGAVRRVDCSSNCRTA